MNPERGSGITISEIASTSEILCFVGGHRTGARPPPIVQSISRSRWRGVSDTEPGVQVQHSGVRIALVHRRRKGGRGCAAAGPYAIGKTSCTSGAFQQRLHVV